MPELKGKVAIITGAASGIGCATARAFAAAGMSLALSDVAVESGEALAAELRASGTQAEFFRTDVANPEDCKRLVQSTVEKFGALHIAFNNAGISDGPAPPGTADYPLELWQRIIAVNLSGVFYCLRYQIPEILRSGGGAIVNTSSIAGQIAFPGVPGYVASKHGVVGLTKVVAAEYGARGIRCNAVGPGFIETPMTSDIFGNAEVRSMLLAGVPSARIGTAEEIAQAVLWLCSDASSYVNGAYIPVDGGYLAR